MSVIASQSRRRSGRHSTYLFPDLLPLRTAAIALRTTPSRRARLPMAECSTYAEGRARGRALEPAPRVVSANRARLQESSAATSRSQETEINFEGEEPGQPLLQFRLGTI